MSELSAPVFSPAIEAYLSDLVDRCLSRETVGGIEAWRANGFSKIFRSIKELGFQRIFVCGAGTHTEVLWPLLLEVFGRVDGVIDREPEEVAYRGVPLFSRADYSPKEGDAVVLSSASFEEDMFRELRDLYGPDLPLFRLYSDDSWIRFCEEKESMPAYWEDEYRALWESTRTPETGGLLNASGLGFVMAYDYTFIAERLFPTISVAEGERIALGVKLEESFEAQLAWGAGKVGRGKTLLLETYALGNHVIQPVHISVNQLLDLGYIDRVLVIVSDQRAKEFFSQAEKDERWVVLDWSMGSSVGYFLPELSEATLMKFAEECESLPPRLRCLLERSKVEIDRSLRLVAGLYAPWLERLIKTIRPIAFMNVLDNRPVSAAYYLTKASRHLPSLQIQHGFQTLALAPYWAKHFIGWKDPHSVDQYRAVESWGCYHAVGNYFLRYLGRQIAKTPKNDASKPEGRVLVFVFQGPPYWHVTHERLLRALKIVKGAIGMLEDEWSVFVKLRSSQGTQFLEDFFGDAPLEERRRISWSQGGDEGWKIYWQADAVAVLSSTAREEAAYLGKPILSLEEENSPACLSFAHYGMSRRIGTAEDLAECLNRLPRELGELVLNRDMEADDALLREAFDAALRGEGEVQRLR